MNKLVMSLIMFVVSFSVLANSESTSEKKMKIKADTPQGVDEADQVITNKMMRAATGSLSDLSITTAWSYSAGTVSDPLNVERPNIMASGDVAAVQALSGTMAGTYRLTKTDRLSFGIGLYTAAPFHQNADGASPRAQNEFDRNSGRVDLNDPYLGYSKVLSFAGIQTVVSATLLKFTTGFQVDNGYDYQAGLVVNTMYDFGGSPFSAGLYVGYWANVINNDIADTSQENLQARQAIGTFAVLPQAEYIINDTFNVRTIIRPFWYDDFRATSEGNWTTRQFTQSVGVGISVSRDVFLYPNIQFQPENLQSDATNIGLAANINMF